MFFKLLNVSIFGLFVFISEIYAETSLPTISEEEANKYEVEYLKEYEELKKTPNDSIVKWIQPKNKKEACKIYVETNSQDDYTLKDNYVLYWDGECKDGYANGLGREMEYRDYSYHYQIGIYKNGKAEDYCVQINEAEGSILEGECFYSQDKVNYSVWTRLKDKEGDVSIKYSYGARRINTTPALLIDSSPLEDYILFRKIYKNFLYRIIDTTQDEFDKKNYLFQIMAKKMSDNFVLNGFAFQKNKDGSRIDGEYINNKLERKVSLPESYINKASHILSEIKEAGDKALAAQEKARIIKTKYKMKICKEKVKVNYMDNEEYKAICQEDKKFEELRIKINQKLDRLNLVKQQKLQQLNEEKRLKVQQNADAQVEALAKQRTAIAEEALEEQRRANLNQGFQNLNQTLQLQQMNRNMSWDALTPKRFDVYMH
jgi:hypothetical protein